MQSKPKVNSIVTHRLTEGGMLLFTVRDAGSFVFNPFACHADIQHRAAIHGFIQRISDGAAIERGENGAAATPNDKRARMERIAEHLASGTTEWNLRAAGGAQTDAGLVILAMVRAAIAPDADNANSLVLALMSKRTIDRRAALDVWASTAKVASALADIRAERAAKVAESANLDSDDLLDELLAAQPAGGQE